MKKILTSFILFIFGMLFLIGCGTSKNSSPNVVSPIPSKFANAPVWVLDGGGSIEGGLAAAGSAPIGKAGLSFARSEALANARDELARQISIKVENLFKNFKQSTGIGNDETVERVVANVSKQITDITLSGSRQKDMWISPENDLFILVVIDTEMLKNNIGDSVKTSMKNENALWQQSQAAKAQEELDKKIDEQFDK